MAVVEVLERLGGTATRAQLVAATSRAEVERAIAAGDLSRLARGRWALPQVDDARAAAHRLTGVVSHTSAALLHGWKVKHPPAKPHVTVRRGRRGAGAADVHLHRADLSATDVADGLVTTQARTLIDCLRTLPFDEAVAVADSALRNGFGRDDLRRVAEATRGAGAARVRRAAEEASPLAANPFESVLRAIALEVDGLAVEPQVEIWEPEFLGRVDLADRRLRIVIEADSFEWHGGRDQLASDCRRYNGLVIHGWLVLRFSWEDVMFHADEVRRVLQAVVDRLPEGRCDLCRAA
jgi:very-short-patch-repair endonuclease